MSLVLSDIKIKLINIIVQCVTNEQIIDTLNVDELTYIIKYAKFHNIENIVYKGLKLSNVTIPEEFEKINKLLFQKAIVQDCELESIIYELNKNRIYHLPLKGAIIRKLYPFLEMRNMCDLDIFIEKENLESVKKVLIDLGYKFEDEGGTHDVYVKPPFMNIEIHKKMLDDDFDNFNYYGDVMNKVIKKEYSYLLSFSNEDLYIYNILHAGKHFSNGGTGLRILLDIYYLCNSYIDLDFNYINKELKKINLDTFANALLNLSKKIFKKEILNTDEELLLDFIIDSGTYGNLTHSSTRGIINNQDGKISKFKFILKRIFPSLKQLKQRYPILQRHPLLTPLYWFKRLFSVLFNRKRREGYISGINNIDEMKIQQIKRIKEITKL